MKTKPEQLTSVKVRTDVFEEFKINTIKYKFSINKLVNRAADLYNTDEEFRKIMNNHMILNIDKKEE